MATLAGSLVAAPLLEAGALTLDRYGIQILAKPGELVSGAITLTNEKSVPVVLDLLVKDLSVQPPEFRNWLKLGRSEVPIQAQSSTQLEYTILLPEKAAGQFLSRISFTERPRSNGLSAAAILTRLSIHLAATVAGTEVYRGDITAAGARGGSRPIVHLTVENRGNVYVKPRGTCVIFDAATSNRVAEVAVNRHGEAVHVGRSEQLIGLLDAPLPPGEYQVEASLSFADRLTLEKHLSFTVTGDSPCNASP